MSLLLTWAVTLSFRVRLVQPTRDKGKPAGYAESITLCPGPPEEAQWHRWDGKTWTLLDTLQATTALELKALNLSDSGSGRFSGRYQRDEDVNGMPSFKRNTPSALTILYSKPENRWSIQDNKQTMAMAVDAGFNPGAALPTLSGIQWLDKASGLDQVIHLELMPTDPSQCVDLPELADEFKVKTFPEDLKDNVLPFVVSGAQGRNTVQVNGQYIPSAERINGFPAYTKVGDSDIWVCFCAGTGKWCVQQKAKRGEDNSFCNSLDLDCPLPTLVEEWQVWIGKGWEAQDLTLSCITDGQ